VVWAPGGWTGWDRSTPTSPPRVRAATGNVAPTLTTGHQVYAGKAQHVALGPLRSNQDYAFSVWTEDTNGNVSAVRHALLAGSVVGFGAPKIVPYGVRFSTAEAVSDVATDNRLNEVDLTVQTRPLGTTTWHTFSRALVQNRGVLAASPVFKKAEQMRVLYTGDLGHLGAVSRVLTIHVAPALADATFSGPIAVGGTEVVKGAVRPNLAGKRIFLQRKEGSRWRTTESTRLTSTSRFRFSFTIGARGRYTYRATMAATAGLVALRTASFVVKVG
jgi:hypothetical protein